MRVKNQDIKLKEVIKSDCLFLYELLDERKPWMNISHKKMPTYEEHVKFVMSKPYSKWYIIILKNQKVGAIYLSKQNEMGIWLKKGTCGKGIGTIALQLLMKQNHRKRYLANINPKNKNSIRFFKNKKFKLVQHTYELMVPDEK